MTTCKAYHSVHALNSLMAPQNTECSDLVYALALQGCRPAERRTDLCHLLQGRLLYCSRAPTLAQALLHPLALHQLPVEPAVHTPLAAGLTTAVLPASRNDKPVKAKSELAWTSCWMLWLTLLLLKILLFGCNSYAAYLSRWPID